MKCIRLEFMSSKVIAPAYSQTCIYMNGYLAYEMDDRCFTTVANDALFTGFE